MQNPTDFPLMTGATILDVKPFSQTVTASSGRTSALTSQGAGTYAGTEVLAASASASADLTAWLAGVEKNPPTGYEYQSALANNSPEVVARLKKYGVAYGVFKSTDPAKHRAVIVVVMDPALVRQKLGLAIDLVDKYRSLPESFRQPIDNELKAKTGVSATEATDPSAPLGITLAALKELQTKDKRAIVLVDAAKR